MIPSKFVNPKQFAHITKELPLPPQYEWFENSSDVGAKYVGMERWCLFVNKPIRDRSSCKLHYCANNDDGGIKFVKVIAHYDADQIEDVLRLISTTLLLGVEQTYNNDS